MRCPTILATFSLLALFISGLAFAEKKPPEPAFEVQVEDAYLDIRTGPGLDFPVIYVALRGDVLKVRLHRPGWYRVEYGKAHSGWVTEEEMNQVMSRAGLKFGSLMDPQDQRALTLTVATRFGYGYSITDEDML